MKREIERFLNNQALFSSTMQQHTEAEHFLDLIQAEAGLIVELGTDENGEALYGFVHRTFQEYFAAAAVYEQYLQEEEPDVISNFLRASLYDPHWREVILLLFGKLRKAKPVTAQLRQILDGKIKNQRSTYADIIQQDLFFVCSCLSEEIDAEKTLGEIVVTRLCNLMKSSPFQLQRDQALDGLASLLQTRRYADIAKEGLIHLVIEDVVIDIQTKIQVTQILVTSNALHSSEQQQVFHILTNLIQQPTLAFTEAIQVAQIPTERNLRVYLLSGLMQRSELSFEQVLLVSQTLFRLSSEGSIEHQQTRQMLLNLSQQSDISLDQALLATQAWYDICSDSEKDQAHQVLLNLVQRATTSFEQTLLTAQALYKSSAEPEAYQQATQMLLNLARKPDISIRQGILVARTLDVHHKSWSAGSRWSGDAGELLDEIFTYLVQRPHLSFEDELMAVGTFYSNGSYSSSSKTRQMLLDLIWRPGIPFEQTIQAIRAYLFTGDLAFSGIVRTTQGDTKTDPVVRRLSSLLQYPNIIDEQIEIVAQLLHESHFEYDTKIGIPWQLLKSPSNSAEQAVMIAQAFCQWFPLYFEQRRAVWWQAVSMLLRHLELPEAYPYLSLPLGDGFYPSENRREALNILWQLIGRADTSAQQRLQIASVLLSAEETTIEERVHAVKVVLNAMEEEQAKQHFATYWSPINLGKYQPTVSDIPYIVELIRQQLLPLIARNQMYQMLRDIVPQLGNAETAIQ